jgi:hypothetical protein
MSEKKILTLISYSIIFLSFIVAAIGLFWSESSSPYSYVTHRGESVEIYNQGLYKYDSLLVGSGNRGTDAAILGICIPLLLLAVNLYLKGKNKAKVFLSGVLVSFLYLYATYAIKMAYNSFFLLYVILFSLSLYGFIISYKDIYSKGSESLFSNDYNKKWIGIFLIVMGLFTGIAWVAEPAISLFTDFVPVLEIYPSLFTHAVDAAIMVPIFIVSGVMILKKNKKGYILGIPLLFVTASLVPMVISMTASQIMAGVQITLQQFISLVVSFVIMGAFAVLANISIIKNIK